MDSLGKKIKDLRTKSGYTQTELAKMLDVSTSAVSMYEMDRREPNNEKLRKMCGIFGVSPEYFLGGNENFGQKKEISAILEGIKCQLDNADGLMLNGDPINDEDKEKLFDAMLVAVNVMFGGKIKLSERKGKDEEKDNRIGSETE